MTRKPPKLTAQVRARVEASGYGRNELARAAGIDKASLSRFMTGTVGLTQSNLDALADVLHLELKKPGRRGRKKLPPRWL